MKLALITAAAFVVAGCSTASEDASNSTAAETQSAPRVLVADVEHYDMLASNSSVEGGSWVGYPTDRATVHLELTESDGHRSITAHFEDHSSFMRSLDTVPVVVAADGSFVAFGATADVTGPGCCPPLYERYTYDLTVAGTVTPEGKVTITTKVHREHGVRSPSQPDFIHLDDLRYESHSVAGATLH